MYSFPSSPSLPINHNKMANMYPYSYYLPLELILLTAEFLSPHGLLLLIRALPSLLPLLNTRHLTAQDSNGDTIVHLIAKRELEDLAGRLTRNRRGLSITNHKGLAPLHVAVLRVYESRQLSRGPGRDSKLNMNRDLMFNESRNLTIFRALIDAGADLNVRAAAPRRCQETPLFYAVSYGCKDMVKILLDAGADPSIPNKFGGAPLLNAAYWNYRGIVQMLLDAGADTSYQYSDMNALMFATAAGSDDSVKLILDTVTDPAEKSAAIGAAMKLAVRYGRETTLQLLREVDHGINKEKNHSIPRMAIARQEEKT